MLRFLQKMSNNSLRFLNAFSHRRGNTGCHTPVSVIVPEKDPSSDDWYRKKENQNFRRKFVYIFLQKRDRDNEHPKPFTHTKKKSYQFFSDRLSAIHKSEKVVGKCWTNKKLAYIMTSQSMKRQEVIQIGPAAMSRVDGCIGSGIDGFKNRRNSKWLDRDPVACWLSDQRYGSWNEGDFIISYRDGSSDPVTFLVISFPNVRSRWYQTFFSAWRLSRPGGNSEMYLSVIDLWRNSIYRHFHYLRKHSSASF